MLIPESTMAASKKIDQRWFEVEVILFSQLGDKNVLKERFDEKSQLPKYRTFDLLKDYIQPDLSSIKTLLPQCEDKQYPPSLVVQSAQPPAFFVPQTLESIDENTEVDWPTDTRFETNPSLEVNDEQETSESILAEQENTTNDINISDDSLQINGALNNDTLIQATDVDEQLVGLTEQEVALVNQAQSTFSPIQFKYTQAPTPWFKYGANNKQLALCRLGEKQESNDAFPVTSLTGRINNPEFVYTDNPYLISSDSLQLKDIYLQLRRSRDFKPLLHLGWRQSLINRKPAEQNKALKIYAGDNFQQQYQDELQDVERAINEAKLNAWLAKQQLEHAQNSELVNDSNSTETLPIVEEVSPIAKKLNYIFDHIDDAPSDKGQLVAQLDNPNIYDTLMTQTELDNSLDQLEAIKQPIEPVQPWYLDGLFRLHLSHYLYITADFNISNLTAAELATAKLTGKEDVNWQSIPFTQNRRVISGEVHYFDHPYMGMVVQIRRYKKPEPEEVQEDLDTNTQSEEE